MNDMTYSRALGTLEGHIHGIRISYQFKSSDLHARLEKLFAAMDKIDAELAEAERERIEALGYQMDVR